MLNWQTLPLGKVVIFQRGYDLPRRDRRDGEVLLVSSAGITDRHSVAMVEPPGVVTGRYGTIGELFYLTKPFWPLNTTLYVRDFLGNDPKFVYYLLQTFDFSAFSGKSGVPGVNRNDLHAEIVSIPTAIGEQRAIANSLSDMDALIDGLTRLIAKKRDLKQAVMQQLLTGQTRLPGFSEGWEVKQIGDFTDCIAGGTPSTKVAAYWDGHIPWMSSGELNLKQVHMVEGRITNAGLANSSTKIIPKKCVLIGLAGQGKTRGTVAMNHIELCTNQSIAAIFPNEFFISQYLYYNLESRYDELRELSAGDGGRGGLNLKIIRSIELPFPSVKEQAAIAAVLSDMDAELAALDARLVKTRALKQAMMQELLTGKTRLI